MLEDSKSTIVQHSNRNQDNNIKDKAFRKKQKVSRKETAIPRKMYVFFLLVSENIFPSPTATRSSATRT